MDRYLTSGFDQLTKLGDKLSLRDHFDNCYTSSMFRSVDGQLTERCPFVVHFRSSSRYQY
ncbi:hypothetical protein BLOT_001376 [Blomia tropicalis]|nr:hypothetical protein BLOT_001376 [Blomia tropicalis]